MDRIDLIEALGRDLWGADLNQLLTVAGVLGHDLRALAANLSNVGEE